MRSKRQKFRKQGFTLVEMLVVLGIMIVILVSAVPVFNTMTGNHSLAAAQNQVAAALGTARADAIYYQQTIGIFFFVDPATGQVALAEVQCDLQTTGVTTYVPTNGSPSNNAVSNNGNVNALELVNYWDFTQNKFVYYRDLVLLPANVGIALNNNYYGYIYNAAAPPAAGNAFDRYVRLGAIMFNSEGSVISIPFAVQAQRNTPYTIASQPVCLLGRKLGLRIQSDPMKTGDLASLMNPAAAPPNPPSPVVYPLTSQLALLFYDRDAFLNQKSTNTSSPGDPFTDIDLEYQLPGQTLPPAADKADEETWLDANGTAVLVSPNNGSLINAK